MKHVFQWRIEFLPIMIDLLYIKCNRKHEPNHMGWRVVNVSRYMSVQCIFINHTQSLNRMNEWWPGMNCARVGNTYAQDRAYLWRWRDYFFVWSDLSKSERGFSSTTKLRGHHKMYFSTQGDRSTTGVDLLHYYNLKVASYGEIPRSAAWWPFWRVF